jgi:N4-gp56 family major capsid protein
MAFGDGTTATDTSTTHFSAFVQTTIQKKLEEALRYPPVHLAAGNYRPASFVKGSNGTLRFLQIGDIAADAAADIVAASAGTAPWLNQGLPPVETEMTLNYEEMTAYQAGRVIRVTDVAALESPVDLLAAAGDLVARDALVVADQYVANVLLAGANRMTPDATEVRLAIGAIANTDVMTADTIKRAVTKLKASNVPTFPDGTYHAIIHPYVVYDLMSDIEVGGWIDASRYAGSRALLNGELGQFAGVRFSESSGAGKTLNTGVANIVDVLSTIIFGPEAYAFGDFQTTSVKVTPPGGHSDPLGQSALVGWKGFFGCKVLGLGHDGAAANGVGPRYIRIDSATAAMPASAI